MRTGKGLVYRVVYTLAALAAAAALGACSTTTGLSSPMTMGPSVSPPPGAIAFCQNDQNVCIDTQFAAPIDGDNVRQEFGGGGAMPTKVVAGHPIPNFGASGIPEPIVTQVSLEAEMRVLVPDVQRSVAPAPERVEISADQLELVRSVNLSINRQLHWRADSAVHGVTEVWSLPLTDGTGVFGDCEDFALEKRRALIARGVPAAALGLATAYSRATGLHAVLVVRTTQGDYVLDNTTPFILPWFQTDYVWLRIQDGESLLSWRRVQAAGQSI